jgi:hypothetical protein
MPSLAIHYDTAVWLKSPRADMDVDAWVDEATKGCVKAFKIKDRKLKAWVQQFLDTFARADQSGNRFLRPAGFVGVPVMANLVALADEQPGAVAAAAEAWDPDVAWFDDPVTTPINVDTGLVRHQRTMVGAQGEPLIQVRYYVGVAGLDVMLRVLDLDPKTFATAVDDLDRLADGIELSEN